MRDFAGKTAFVTGGASGIGLSLGYAFAEAGMHVMLADIEAKPLEQAVASLQEQFARGARRGVRCAQLCGSRARGANDVRGLR